MNNALDYPYNSHRVVTFARNGMVATSQHLAAQAGLDVLKKGGNAADAAVATAVCLTVTEPCSNGIGGDAFALVWNKEKLYGLNSSGPSPKSLTARSVTDLGYEKIPEYGWIPVNVPGAPAAWAALNRRFGRLPLAEVMKPAIEYAMHGYPVSPVVADAWRWTFEIYGEKLKDEQYRYWFDTFAPKGRAPFPGEMWNSPELASSLRSIAESDAQSFYRGDLAERIDAFSREFGGFLRKEDLEAFEPEWVDPVSINYRGYDIWEIPPNGQGIAALMALNILKRFEFSVKDSVKTYHRQIEAMKLAFSDSMKHITDRSYMKVKVSDLLSEAYAEERSRLIGSRALDPVPGKPFGGGTVYLAAADNEGCMVSFIQSNFAGFGSGLVVPGTGISLHNRGLTFSLDPQHSNYLEPGKKTYHTIIPGFMTRGGKAVGPFGVMGAYMQPQGHVQVVMNTIDFGMNPQAALDAPRWRWIEGRDIHMENAIPKHIFDELSGMGHNVAYKPRSGAFGRGQIIWRDENGVLCGGTEPWADGNVAAW